MRLKMAGFLDKVSNVINNTASEISDKAKEISEVSSLNGQIRSQEKIIQKTCLELGQSYYEAHKDDESDHYFGLMQKITEAKETVEKLREDVRNIKDN